MKNIILTVITLLTLTGVGATTNKVEILNRCSKCAGTGKVVEYVKCERCNGTSLIESEIHNRGMGIYGVAHWEGDKDTKINRKPCPDCVKSPKRGKIKTYVECEACNGEGKIHTGKFVDQITYDDGELQEIRAKNTKSKKQKLADRNAMLIRQANITKKLKGLKLLRDKTEAEWKKLVLKENTPENLEKKMTLQRLIKKYEIEIAELEKMKSKKS